MGFAVNADDATRIYFEEDGGSGVPVVMLGGFLDSVRDLRESHLARAFATDEFRRIYVDHRGLGRSGKPRGSAAYAMPLRARDPVAVLDVLGIERAHFIGLSWGGRLVFGIGEHAPERVLSLVAVGQQPYAWPASPLTRAVSDGVERGRLNGSVAVVEALERFWGVRFPKATRDRWLKNDAVALADAWYAAIGEGPISRDLRAWRRPCLICVGSGDADFIDGARRAATEIPKGRFIELSGSDHYQAHVSEDDVLTQAVFETLRAVSTRP